MLLAVIIGSSRSGPGRFAMRSRTLRRRRSSRLRLCSRALLRVHFADFLGIVAVTRKPPASGIMRMCFYLHYSGFAGGFRVFFWIFDSIVFLSRLVKA